MLKLHYTKVKRTKIWRWRDVKDGDLKALRVIPFLGSVKRDAKAYERLMDDYIQTFGLPEGFMKKFKIEKELADLMISYLAAPLSNRKTLNKINQKRDQLENLKAKGSNEKTLTIGQMVANIRKNGGIIDENRDTIYTLENMVRSYE